MLHNKKRWIALLLCIVAAVTLAVTVLAMSMPGQPQLQTVPTVPTVPQVTTLPDVPDPTVPPTEPPLPSLPQFTETTNATLQPNFGLVPPAPTLEPNYLKNKDFKKEK